MDLRYIVKEMKELTGSRVQKIYGNENDFLIVLYKGVKTMIRIHLPNLIFITKYKKEYGEPSNFVMLLRKYLTNDILEKIYQYDSERIVVFEFKSNKKLIVELFSKGNIILCENNKIIRPLKFLRLQSRKIVPNTEYIFPKTTDVFSMTKQEMLEIAKNYDKVVKFLASGLHLGKFYSELLSKGIKNEKPQSRIQEIIQRLKVIKSDPKPNLFGNSFLPFLFNEPKKIFKSYNELIDEIYHEEESKISINQEKLQKLKNIIEKQNEKLEEVNQKIKEYKKIGDEIFLNLNKYQEMIDLARKHKQVEGRLEGKNLIVGDIILDIQKSAIKNGEEYYKKYKKMKGKVEGIKKAMKDITKKMNEERIDEDRKIEEIKKKIEEAEKKVKEWYEEFRWIKFYDFIAIGGKNASQNEILIDKHLDDKDIVFHADIYGSPFVILKDGSNSNNEIKKLAAQFTLCYSRAWREKIPVDVYWVKPNQVSKKATSGEYVQYGSFIIRGKKNYVKGIPLEWYIGIKDYKIICGPKEYVTKFTNNFIKIIPGEKSRDKIAKEIREKLAINNKMIMEIPIEQFVRCSIDKSEII